MNVAYSSSDLFSPLAGISLTSLLMNNVDIDEINIYVIDNNISAENKQKLTKTAEKYGRSIFFIPLDDTLRNVPVEWRKVSVSTYGRLLESTMLPAIDKVIHIDCDTVVTGSLKPLWDLDMSDAVIAGAPECLSRCHKENAGLRSGDKYFNAGILVFNLQRIRQLKLEEKFLAYMNENWKCMTYDDQEVLNACIPMRDKIFLPLRYNSYSIIYYVSNRHLEQLRKVDHIFSEEEQRDAIEDPVIIHYTTCFLEGTRPWVKGDNHPKRDLFLHYKHESLWRDMPDWDDSRPMKKKVSHLISRAVPIGILAPIVGYVHGVYVPKRNRRRRESGKMKQMDQSRVSNES